MPPRQVSEMVPKRKERFQIHPQPVFGIRDILERIRIRILLFSSVTFIQDNNKNTFYAHSLSNVHLHHSSKIKVIKKTPNSRNQGFLFISSLVDGRIRIRTNKLRIRIQEAHKTYDPTDPGPDPEHCQKQKKVVSRCVQRR
jgi:hypothetical protein